jgi:hypothetical protein
MVDRGDEVVIDSGGEYLRQISLEGSDCQVVFTDASALATGPSFFCLVLAHVIQFTIVSILIVKRQGWGESCRIRLWEREAYVLKGARTSPKGEVRESKHAVEPGANSTGPCGRPHGRH